MYAVYDNLMTALQLLNKCKVDSVIFYESCVNLHLLKIHAFRFDV